MAWSRGLFMCGLAVYFALAFRSRPPVRTDGPEPYRFTRRAFERFYEFSFPRRYHRDGVHCKNHAGAYLIGGTALSSQGQRRRRDCCCFNSKLKAIASLDLASCFKLTDAVEVAVAEHCTLRGHFFLQSRWLLKADEQGGGGGDGRALRTLTCKEVV